LFLGITYIFTHIFFLAAFDSTLLVGFYPDVAISMSLDDFLCHDRLRAQILNANMNQLYQFMMLHGLNLSSSTRKQLFHLAIISHILSGNSCPADGDVCRQIASTLPLCFQVLQGGLASFVCAEPTNNAMWSNAKGMQLLNFMSAALGIMYGETFMLI
jgi:hypothetical protein